MVEVSSIKKEIFRPERFEELMARIGVEFDKDLWNPTITAGLIRDSDIRILDNQGKNIFTVIRTGPDAGDMIVGDFDGGQGFKYDKSANSILYKGAFIAESYYRISNDTYASDDAEEENGFHAYTLVKTLTLPSNFPTLTIRVHMEIEGQAGENTFGKIYKNGVAYGTERVKNDVGYSTFNEDLEFTADDAVELYYYNDGVANAITKNFRILGTTSFSKYTITAS